MPWTARHKYARISPHKTRLVVDLIRGRKADEALELLKFSPKRAGHFVHKVLQSAISNADEDEADVEVLYVSKATVDQGPVLKRWQAKDRGRIYPIRKPTCHITIVVETKSH